MSTDSCSVDLIREYRGELREELLGTGDNLNPFKRFTSASRSQMTNKFLGQKLVVRGAEARRFYTGAEAQLGKHNFGATMPCDGEIIKIIPKYRTTVGQGSIGSNPETAVVYEDVENDTIGVVMVKQHHTDHKTFGFKFRLNQVSVGDALRKDHELSSIPTIDKNGQYCYGLEAEVAFMTHPVVTEDGVAISKSLQKRLATTLIGKRVESWGKKYYPLNLYGDDENYKPFPDIGDKIHPCGLIMALRAFDPMFDMVNLSPKALRYEDVDYDNDRTVYAVPNATVTDITVTKDPRRDFSRIPTGMEEQTDKYHSQHTRYYKEIIELYKSLQRRRGKGLKLTPKFHNLIVEATKHTEDKSMIFKGDNKRRYYNYRGTPLDDVRVEISYAAEILPREGFKLTNCHGGKAVICAVLDDHMMPTNADGVRAEMIMDPISIQKRMNGGTLYEQFMNATRRDIVSRTGRIRDLMDAGKDSEAWALCKRFYDIISPPMAQVVEETIGDDPVEQAIHLKSIYRDGLHIYLPPWSPSLNMDTVGLLWEEMPCTYGPVTYVGESGRRVTTKNPVLIGSNYIMLLNKIGDQWTAVTGSKLQHQGVPARMHTADRNLTPGRQNPVKITDESTTRLFLGAVGSDTTAEIMDRSNSPESNKAVCKTIVSADVPSNIEVAVDRDVVPATNNRALRFVEHINKCAGFTMVRKDIGGK